MGVYIDPQDRSKEKWLADYTIKSEAGLLTNWSDTPPGMLPVVLVHNGAFTAAAIAYSPKELDVFLDENDERPKWVFFALIEDLLRVCPNLKSYMR